MISTSPAYRAANPFYRPASAGVAAPASATPTSAGSPGQSVSVSQALATLWTSLVDWFKNLFGGKPAPVSPFNPGQPVPAAPAQPVPAAPAQPVPAAPAQPVPAAPARPGQLPAGIVAGPVISLPGAPAFQATYKQVRQYGAGLPAIGQPLNPTYYATIETAHHLARLYGGRVLVQGSLLSGAYRGWEDQISIVWPNGHVENAGLLADTFAHAPASVADRNIRALIDQPGDSQDLWNQAREPLPFGAAGLGADGSPDLYSLGPIALRGQAPVTFTFQRTMQYGPGGFSQPMNPIYFASQETATWLATRYGGILFSKTPLGGPFSADKPEVWIRFANGHEENAGLLADTFAHWPADQADMRIREMIATR